MIKFFRKIRLNMFKENPTYVETSAGSRVSKYLLYAIGEIVLVVIGILIALQINIKNEQRKQNNQLVKIQERIALDMDNDIRELSRSLTFWKEKEPLFNKVINDSISEELLDQGISRLLTGSRNTILNKTGIQQLKALNIKDMLSLRILDIYDSMENIAILPLEEKIDEEIDLIRIIHRDKYDWYPEWMGKTIMKDNSSKELQDYFLYSKEYRHRVIYFNQQVFNNYVPNLEHFIYALTETKNQLKVKFDNNIKPISKKELEQYVGTYKIYKIESDIRNDDGVGIIWEFIAFDNMLRIVNLTNPSNIVFDSFYIEEDTFLFESTNFRITVIFERDNSQNIIGLKFLRELFGGNDILYATKQNVE
jgi:Family of unknown function (DUF6090)